MRQTGLVTQPVALLGGIAVGYPQFGFMPGHRVVHDLGCLAELCGVDHGIGRTKHPLVGIASFDPHARLVAGHNLCATQGHERIFAPGGKDRRGTLEHIHQRALAELQAKQIGEDALLARRRLWWPV